MTAGGWRLTALSYLSPKFPTHRVSVPDLYAGLATLVPERTAQQLEALYKDPRTTTRAMVEALARGISRRADRGASG